MGVYEWSCPFQVPPVTSTISGKILVQFHCWGGQQWQLLSALAIGLVKLLNIPSWVLHMPLSSVLFPRGSCRSPRVFCDDVPPHATHHHFYMRKNIIAQWAKWPFFVALKKILKKIWRQFFFHELWSPKTSIFSTKFWKKSPKNGVKFVKKSTFQAKICTKCAKKWTYCPLCIGQILLQVIKKAESSSGMWIVILSHYAQWDQMTYFSKLLLNSTSMAKMAL